MRAVPAIRSKMGDTVYYLTHLSGRELSHIVRPVRDSDVWANATMEERIQRDLNEKRVLEEIVPYIANHPDRFWGSIIVLAERGQLVFEKFTDIVRDTPLAYASSASSMGFLTQLGGEMIALDGQHRWLAVHHAITSGDDLGPLQRQVNDDQMAVIVIEFESAEKTRRLFNKVNRHAKPTSKTDDILLSEDDGYAIVTRWMLEPSRKGAFADLELPDGKTRSLVDWRKNSLGRGSAHLTTLKTLYEASKEILSTQPHRFPVSVFDEKRNPCRPDEKLLEEAHDFLQDWWETTIANIPILNDVGRGALVTDELRTIRFSDDDPRTLLLRPVGQAVMARALVLAQKNAQSMNMPFNLATTAARVAQVNWSASPQNYFRDNIIRPDGTVNVRNESQTMAANLVAYLIGHEYMTEPLVRSIWAAWNADSGRLVHGEAGQILTDAQIEAALAALPDDEAEARRPIDLPAPISAV